MIAALIVVAMYVLMIESISEMAAAMPHRWRLFLRQGSDGTGAVSSPGWPKPSVCDDHGGRGYFGAVRRRNRRAAHGFS